MSQVSGDPDVESELPFSRRSCTFAYCPHPEGCRDHCEHPYGRGPEVTHFNDGRTATQRGIDSIFNPVSRPECPLRACDNLGDCSVKCRLCLESRGKPVWPSPPIAEIAASRIEQIGTPPVIQYKVLAAQSDGAIAESVNEHIQEGWEPQGGIHVLRWQDSDGVWSWEYTQAVVMRDTAPPQLLLPAYEAETSNTPRPEFIPFTE